MGNVVNKFGRAPDGVQDEKTDIWDLANATPTQPVWLPPTAASIHTILSSSSDDDGDPVGVGARTIRVYGLNTWASLETSEDITLNGVGGVVTTSSYVIIHRMKVLTSGTTNINVGNIKATAAAGQGGQITAQINAGEGQTQMAIYGVPSTQDLILDCWYGTLNKGQGSTGTINFSLLVNDPVNFGTNTTYLIKNTRGLQANGSSSDIWSWPKGFLVSGPAIIKVQGIASVDDIEGSGGFNGKLQDK